MTDSTFGTVYKYSLSSPVMLVSMPKGAKVLRAGVQREHEIVIWALVDLNQPDELRRFGCINTGVAFSPIGTYIDTVTVEGIVWHIFEYVDD